MSSARRSPRRIPLPAVPFPFGARQAAPALTAKFPSL